MPNSESEKLGVGSLRCHFSEKAEIVPFKKRKFMLPSPSPPHNVAPPHCDEAQRLVKSQSDASDFASSTSNFCQTVDTKRDAVGTNLRSIMVKLDENGNFPGISTLAAASFSNSFGGGNDPIEETSGVEKSFVIKGPSTNDKFCSFLKEKEELGIVEISPAGIASCISVAPVEDPVAGVPIRMINSYRNDMALENDAREHSVWVHSAAESEDLPIRKDEVTERVHGLSSRADRLHWDLNISMEVWEHPSDYQYANPSSNVADGQPDKVKYGSCGDKVELLECKTVEREIGAEKELELAEYGANDYNEELLNIVECKFDSCADTKRTSYFQDNLDSSSKRELQPVDSGAEAQKESSIYKLRPCLDAKRPSSLGENLSSSFGYLDSLSVDIASRSTDSEINASAQFSALCSTEKNDSLYLHQKLARVDSAINNSLTPEINHSSTCIFEPVCDQGYIGFSCMKKEGECAAGTGKFVSSGLQNEKEELAAALTLFGNTIYETQAALIASAKTVERFCDLPDDCRSPKDVVPLKLESVEDVRENVSCQFDEVGLCPASPMGIEMSTLDGLSVESKGRRNNNSKETDACEGGNVVCKKTEVPSTKCSKNCMASINSPSRNNPKGLRNSFDSMPLEESFKDTYPSCVYTDDRSNLEARRCEVDYDSQYEEGEVRESIEHTWKEYDSEDMEARYGDYRTDNVNVGLGFVIGHDMEYPQRIRSHPSPISLKGKDASSEGDMREKDSSRQNGCGDNLGKLDAKDQKKIVEPRASRRALRSCIEVRAADDALFMRKSHLDDPNPRCQRESVYGASFGRKRFTQYSYARGRCDQWVDSRDGNRGTRHHSHGSMSFHYPLPDGSALRHHTKSRSPDARNEAFGMHIRQLRQFSSYRRVNCGRGRSGRHGLQVDGRGSNSKYHGHLPDDCLESSLNKLNPSANLERRFSPIGKRKGPHMFQSHSKSLSRSKSGSPNFRNQWPRQRSKSPYHWSGPLSDYCGGFRPRSHDSPLHSTRLIRDKKNALVHRWEQGCNQHSSFLDRRSPGRRDRQDDRSDFVDSPQSFRSFRLGSCREICPVGGSCLGHEVNDNRKKHGCRYGQVHDVKRYDMDGHRRFHSNLKDGFLAAQNTHYRDSPHFHGRGSPKDLNGH